MKSTAKLILLCQTHAEPPEHLRRMAMAQGVPPPDRAHVIASRNIEFYGEADSAQEAVEIAHIALRRFLATEGLEVTPKQPSEIERTYQKLSDAKEH